MKSRFFDVVPPWHIRTLVALILCVVGVASWTTQGNYDLFVNRTVQLCALVSTVCLYLSLLIKPLLIVTNTTKEGYTLLSWRKPLGITSFVFAVIHAKAGLWLQLDGLAGVVYLQQEFLVALIFGAAGFLVLTFLTLTTFGFFSWFMRHAAHVPGWLAHLALFLILLHAMGIGTHFHKRTDVVPVIAVFAYSLLVCVSVIAALISNNKHA
jgi:DMSO/TMAO reductase YedYZ heme-binding membrane subunit